MTANNLAAITDEQIRGLRAEAAEAGDLLQVGICDIALYGKIARASARAECARVIAEAQAQDAHAT